MKAHSKKTLDCGFLCNNNQWCTIVAEWIVLPPSVDRLAVLVGFHSSTQFTILCCSNEAISVIC